MTRATRSLVDKLLAAVSAHERWRGSECINLIPSETLTSNLVRKLLATDVVNRYTSSEGFYAGTKFINEIESLGEEVARRLFGAEYVSLRLISWHIADTIFLMSHTKPGDKVACVSPDNGGYPGISHRAVAPPLGLESVSLHSIGRGRKRSSSGPASYSSRTQLRNSQKPRAKSTPRCATTARTS